MKKKLIILIVLITSLKQLNAQTGVPDTLAYLQSIAANKSQFIGQPFSKLMDSLKIQIKFFSPFAKIPYDRNKETSTSFSFYFPQNAEQMYLTYPSLEVYWQPYLDARQSDLLYTQYRVVGWNPTIASFYANAMVGDIKILE